MLDQMFANPDQKLFNLDQMFAMPPQIFTIPRGIVVNAAPHMFELNG